MIIAMSKVRVLGPRERLADVLRVIQDLGILHLAAPTAAARLAPLVLDTRQARERRRLAVAVEDVEAAIQAFDIPAGAAPRGRGPAAISDFARWARLGWRMRRAADRLAARAAALDEERALILKYQGFFTAFRSLLESEARWPNATAYHVLLRRGEATVIPKLKASLAAVVGDAFQLFSHTLPTGEIAVLVVVSAPAVPQVERLLAEARVQEIPVPAAYGGKTLTEAIPRMIARLGDLPRDADTIRRERAELARRNGAELRLAAVTLHDRLRELDALPLSGVTARAFVVEGWVPADARPRLDAGLRAAFGEDVAVSELSREEWRSEEAPVVLKNPRLLRPFEVVIKLLPLPRYGSIDPTPFVAVFFPAFFGLMLGDVGYGVVLALLALVVRARSRPGSVLRSVAEVAGACAVFGILAGFLFGELLGDLGRRWLGLRPWAFSREEAIIPFLILAVAIGAVHVLLGLGLGAVGSIRSHPRQALGRGLSALMILLILAALLGAVHVLPGGFFTPAVVALLVAFPVLIIVEGIVAPIELLSTIGNILSYARIMALGVASVMLAVVANRMVGAVGSATVGILFALLFHLVNFAIALFSPTIHALRLHYVEFFGKFYSPGGVRYQPFGHWTRGVVHSH